MTVIIESTLEAKALTVTAIVAGVLEAAASVKDPLAAADIATGAVEAAARNVMVLIVAAITVGALTAVASATERILAVALDARALTVVASHSLVKDNNHQLTDHDNLTNAFITSISTSNSKAARRSL